MYEGNNTIECGTSNKPYIKLHCMNIIDGAINSPIKRLKEVTEDTDNSNAINMIVVHNVEKIVVSEMKRLDFLFRITDKSYEYGNIVILLLWNTRSRPFNDEEMRDHGIAMEDNIDNDIGETDGLKDRDESNENNVDKKMIDLRTFLAAEWSKAGPLGSGKALTGRITRMAFSAKDDATSIISMDGACNILKGKVDKYNIVGYDVYIEFFLPLGVIFLFTLFFLGYIIIPPKKSEQDYPSTKPAEPSYKSVFSKFGGLHLFVNGSCSILRSGCKYDDSDAKHKRRITSITQDLIEHGLSADATLDLKRPCM